MRRQPSPQWLGRELVPLCALVLALCVAHQFLMASERHAAVMGPAGPQSAMATSGLLAAAGPRHGGVHGPEQPVSVMGDCPAQQAVIPLLLLALLALGLLARPLPWPAPGAHGPPLAPAQRRALLQVFQN